MLQKKKIERIAESINNRVIDNYFSGAKHRDINIGDSIIKYMTQDSINKIESQRWKGLDGDLKNEDLKDLLVRSDFYSERQKYAHYFSETGAVVVALVAFEGKDYVQFFKRISSSGYKRELDELVVDTGRITHHNDKPFELHYKWTKEDGKIFFEKILVESETFGEQISTSKTELIGYKRIPATIIRNNPSETPDWVAAANILKELNLLSNDIGTEWENIKTMWLNTGLHGAGRQGKNFRDKIENGERVLGDFSGNAKFATQFGLMQSGSASIVQLLQTISYLEDKALKYSFQGRETNSSGANKHNAEVSLWNQAQSEYLVSKKKQRENDYMFFFKEIVEDILGINAPKKISIESSAYEQGKRDAIGYMQSQREYLTAQSIAQKARAKADLEKANLTKKEVTMKGGEGGGFK